MGLGGTKVKQRFGLDPRNTTWSNDTSRFGHLQLEKYGWKPGMGLGTMPHESVSSHVRVSIKDDNLGLGAKMRRQGGGDAIDDGDCVGLDVFQRLLGRLNGREEQVSKELDRKRVDRVINGRWGVHFVQGDVLASTWDPETRTLKQYSNMTGKTESRKRPVEEDREERKRRKREKKERKERKERKGKKEKKEKKHREKKRKHKKEMKHRNKSEKDTTKPESPAPESTRLSVRSRWIRQKRAATMDPRALREIFMVTDSK